MSMSGKREREGTQSKNSRKRQATSGFRGLILSGMKKQCAFEMIHLLEKYLAFIEGTEPKSLPEKLEGTESKSESEAGNSTAIPVVVGDALKNIGDEVDVKEVKRFTLMKEKIGRGIWGVRFTNASDSPSDIIYGLLTMVKEQAAGVKVPGRPKFYSKYLTKITPIDASCSPYPKDLEALATAVIAKAFPQSAAAAKLAEDESTSDIPVTSLPNGTTWGVQFNSRCNMPTLKRTDVIQMIGEAVGARDAYKVHLDDPNVSIMVDVNPIFCGISIMKEFKGLRKLNISILMNSIKKPEAALKDEAALVEDEAALVEGEAVGADDAEASKTPV